MRKCTICGKDEKFALKVDMDMEGIPILIKKNVKRRQELKFGLTFYRIIQRRYE